MIAAAALTHLTGLVDWVDYRPDDAGGNAFVDHMPDGDGVAVMATVSPGPMVGSRWPWGEPSLQLLVRGAAYDHLGGAAAAQDLIDALDCADSVWWDQAGPDAVHVEGCTHRGQGPAFIGRNDRQQPEWSLNFDLHTQNPTSHRTL